MSTEIQSYNEKQTGEERLVCMKLASLLCEFLPEAEYKIWHKHPVWFIEGNPIVGYSKLKAGVRLMFWSGASFEEGQLKTGSGKFKDASILYNTVDQINEKDLKRWVNMAREIQWDYKNIVKRKGELIRLK